MTRTLTAVSDPASPREPVVSARIAVADDDPAAPPARFEVHANNPADLLEDLFAAAASCSSVPVVALREIIENLVHAEFEGVVVSILEQGRLVRCSDSGPGIADPDRAFQDGYSSAGRAERELIRGVGSGLPLATRAMDAVGGVLTLDDNLGGGAVLALHAPAAAPCPPPSEHTSGAHSALALLLEMESAHPRQLAAELGCSISECGRELVLLEHRGLVARETGGNRRLTEAGAAMIAALF